MWKSRRKRWAVSQLASPWISPERGSAYTRQGCLRSCRRITASAANPAPTGAPSHRTCASGYSAPHVAVDGRPRGRPAPRRDAHVWIEQPIDLVADHRKCPAEADHKQQDREKESTPAVQSERQAAAEPSTTGSRAIGCRHTGLERQPARAFSERGPPGRSRTIPASPTTEAATSQEGLRSACLEPCEARAPARGRRHLGCQRAAPSSRPCGWRSGAGLRPARCGRSSRPGRSRSDRIGAGVRSCILARACLSVPLGLCRNSRDRTVRQARGAGEFP